MSKETVRYDETYADIIVSLSRETDTELCVTYLRPIVVYVCRTWATAKGRNLKPLIFECEILTKIYGPTLNPESGSREKINTFFH